MKLLVLVLVLGMLLAPVLAAADNGFEWEQQAEPSAAARTFASAFLVQFAPDLQLAMAAMEERLRNLSLASGDLFLSKKDQKLFIETSAPESKIVADLRKQQAAPLVRWEARGDFDYVKGGLEFNLTQSFTPATELALRGMIAQEFFEPIDPKYEITAKLIHRF